MKTKIITNLTNDLNVEIHSKNGLIHNSTGPAIVLTSKKFKHSFYFFEGKYFGYTCSKCNLDEFEIDHRIHIKNEDITSIDLNWIETKNTKYPYIPGLFYFGSEKDDILAAP